MPHLGHSRLSPGVHQWPSWQEVSWSFSFHMDLLKFRTLEDLPKIGKLFGTRDWRAWQPFFNEYMATFSLFLFSVSAVGVVFNLFPLFHLLLYPWSGAITALHVTMGLAPLTALAFLLPNDVEHSRASFWTLGNTESLFCFIWPRVEVANMIIKTTKDNLLVC